MTSTVYGEGHSGMWIGWVGSIAGIAITTGEIIAGIMVKKTGKTKFQAIFAMTAATIFLGGEDIQCSGNRSLLTAWNSNGFRHSEYTKDSNGS